MTAGDRAPKRGRTSRVMRVWLTRASKFSRERVHAATVARWSWWPDKLPAVLQPRRRFDPSESPRVAYYIWHFPVLSQTFVRREVEALRRHGASIEVFADGAEDVELLDEGDRGLLTTTRYLLPIDRRLLFRYQRQFRRERPLAYFHVYLFIMSRRYGLTKKLRRDRTLFERTVYLAGHFRDAGIARVHSPWGDRSGFAAMLAAKLLGVPFSVQIRAHDLHDPAYHSALREMLPSADFVITNTQYNRPFIQALMKGSGTEIHTIYNGIKLSEFNPPARSIANVAPVRILCVGRLIEQKGLTYLLDACALLRARNVPFTCDVIGGTEEPLYTEYWERLKERHRDLRLEGLVFFRGARAFAAIMDAYRAADIFVLPCVVARDGRRDITPNAVIEAMAMKLPVISTPITGVVEIVEHGTSGLLVPPENSVALADEIERLTRNRALATRLGENARKRVESRFDADKNVVERLRLFALSHAKPSEPPAEPAMQVSWQRS
ncbi:MAG: glycosyltransferase family 4 protein [Gemmatimonadales bacterium]